MVLISTYLGLIAYVIDWLNTTKLNYNRAWRNKMCLDMTFLYSFPNMQVGFYL